MGLCLPICCQNDVLYIRLRLLGSWLGGTEATDHEAEAALSSQSRESQDVLRLPDLKHTKAAVLNSLTSAAAQCGYRHAVNEFVDWYCFRTSLAFNRVVIVRHWP
jgi:hypothetical protein